MGFAAVVFSAGVVTWSVVAPLPRVAESEDRRVETGSKATIGDSDEWPFSVLLSLPAGRSWRPDVAPPVVQKKPGDEAALPVTPVAPPLRSRLKLVGTVVGAERRHVVLRDSGNSTMVVFEGDPVRRTEPALVVERVGEKSAILRRGTQTETLTLEQR